MAKKQDTTGNSRAHMKLKKGVQLGKYRFGKQLGEGGHCEVWKGWDTIENIWVALKIPHVQVNGQRDNQSVLNEVRLVSQLRHPNIFPIKNVEIIDGYTVLASELSTGTLDDCSKPMGVRRILSIMISVLEGLKYAHKNRIVHCDVTPGNIFLFPNNHVAIGDFGIGVKVKGRMKTTDDFGTPGYVAPEQAYGHPRYCSDCFSAALILYQYITGYLPRWPFKWPPRGYDRLRQRTNAEFTRFMKKALSVDPADRFVNAGQMLTEMLKAMPKMSGMNVPSTIDFTKLDWKQVRRQAFIRRYKRVFTHFHQCVDCSEPITEGMVVCPWCGSKKNKFTRRTKFNYVCPRCHKGILPTWHYCPWCYGPGIKPDEDDVKIKVKYNGHCKHCSGKLMRFMRYCPWCNRKVKKPWRVDIFPETCTKCGWSVDTNFWNSCPWCTQKLV